MKYRLLFPEDEVRYWASKYDYPGDEVIEGFARHSRRRGSLTKEELLELSRWKSRGRNLKRVERNAETFVKAVTATALSTKDERLKIEVLTLLSGVDWPTASAILHFWSKGRYPILDFRALWSLSIKKPNPYTFDFWWEYVGICRRLATKHHMKMRTLDRALWSYSKHKQPKR